MEKPTISILTKLYTTLPQNTCFVYINPVDNVDKAVNNIYRPISDVDITRKSHYTFSRLCILKKFADRILKEVLKCLCYADSGPIKRKNALKKHLNICVIF